MPDNQRIVRLLLDFDQAISWPETRRVTKKALSFFDDHLKLERVSITYNDIQNLSLEVFTKDTSIPHLTSGDKHPLSIPPKQMGNPHNPKYISDTSSIEDPSSVVKALSNAGIKSFFDVPLVIGEDVVGSLNIGSRQNDGVSQETQEIVTLLSARLSLALYHARLHDDLIQKEVALEASEKSYRELIDQAADVILKGNFQGEIIQANIAASRLLGYSNQELLEMNLSELFEPDVLIRKPLRYDLVDEGLTVLSERVFRTKNGNHIPVEMNSKKLSDGTLVSIVRDLTERNKTKERLIDQKNQITALFDATPTLMYAKNPDGRYTMLNDAYLKFFGKKREDMLGKKVTEIWKTPSAKRVEKEDRKLLQDNELQSHATEFKNASGALRQMLARKAVYLDAKGEPAGFVGTLMDYTDLKAAEDRYKALFTNSPDPVVVHDGSNILAANQAAIAFFKTEDSDKYLNTPFSGFIHPDSIDDARARIKDLLSSKSTNTLMKQKFIISTGEVRDVEAMSVSLEDGGRRIIMTSFRDVTEDQATRKALFDSEERYRRVFNHSPAAMVLHDRGILLDANQAALDFAGAKKLEDVMGMDLMELVHPDFKESVMEGIERLLTQGRPASGLREHKYLTLSGDERWIEGSGVPVNQGDKTVILLSFNDIHERVTARQQLDKSRKQLEVITSHITSFLFLVDLDLSFLYINQAAANLLHTSNDALYGVSAKDIIPEKDLRITSSYIPQLLEGKVCTFPHHYISSTQGEFDFIITLIPVRATEGKTEAFLIQMDDVTEIESARKEIAENQELLELIVDTIPGLFSYADMNEKYLYVNEAYASWYGHKKSDVIGKTFSQIIPLDIYEDFKPRLSKISTGEQTPYSQVMKGPDGRDHILDIRNLPHFDRNNKPKAFLTSLQDVTEKREEDIFRESLRRLARQLTISLKPRQVGIIAGKVLHDLFGYDAFALYQINLEKREALGLFAQDTFLEEDKLVEVETGLNPLDMKNDGAIFVLPTPKLINREEDNSQPVAAPFGDLTRRSLSLLFVPIFWEGSQIGLFTLQSYTAEKFQEDDLPKLKIFANQIGGALVRAQSDELILEQTTTLKDRELQLKANVKEKEVLLKEVYHRTKNNMQVILGLLEMQGMKTSSAETQTVIDEMTNRIYSMSMVHDLLYRSKNLAEIMLDTYLKNLIDRLIQAYKTSLGEIVLECHSDAIPINIQTAIPLGLVINEIVSNALKYAFPEHRDGKIFIYTKSVGRDGLEIEIGDDGLGVSSSDMLSGAETLGLQIVRDIVDLQLFGKLKTSTKGGVKYYITIPSLKLD